MPAVAVLVRYLQHYSDFKILMVLGVKRHIYQQKISLINVSMIVFDSPLKTV